MYIWLASPKPSELFCPDGHPFLSSFALLFRSFRCDCVATIQPTSYVPPSLGLALLPICPVCCDSVATIIPSRGYYTDSEITSSLQLYSRIGYRLFPLHQPCGLFRCRFGSATRLPQCYNMSAYLPGLHAARPSAFVEGEGFEPPLSPSSVMRCFQPLSQPSLFYIPQCYCGPIAALTSAASCHHTARSQCSPLSGAADKPTVCLASRR